VNPFRLTYHPALHRRLRRYKEEFLLRHSGKPHSSNPGQNRRWPSIASYRHHHSNVIGVGFGIKTTKGTRQPNSNVLRVYVQKKRPKAKIRAKERIPPDINGLATDVVETGKIIAAMPATGGCSGANPQVAAGTLGCLVRGRSTGNSFILSCYHVLANLSNPNVGDPVFQPAVQAGGMVEIGKLYGWLNLNPSGGNLVDCAVASIDTPGTFTSGLQGIGQINPVPIAANLNQQVMKSGSVSPGVTYGIVTDISADVSVNYPGLSQAFGFVQQIVVEGTDGYFAQEGDSGSLVIDQNSHQPIGLLFSVGQDSSGNLLAFVNPIQQVLDQLNVDIQ
jgi:hypothetical protein